MRATLLRAFILISLAVILLVMPLLLTPHRIRPAIFALIERGMTEAEVVELLGAESGSYDGYRSVFMTAAPVTSADDILQRPTKTWISRHGAVDVEFDEQLRVHRSVAYGSMPQSWWARILERILHPKLTRNPPFPKGLTSAT